MSRDKFDRLHLLVQLRNADFKALEYGTLGEW